MNVVNSLLRGTGINLVGLVFRFAFVFLQTYLAVKLYGTEIFGTYVLAISAVNLLSYVGQFGFSRAVVRYVALYIERGQWDRITQFLVVMLSLTFVCSVGLAFLLNSSSDFIANLFSGVEVTSLLIVIGLAIPCLTLATLLAAFTQAFGVMQYKVITMDILAPALEVLLLLLFWRIGLMEKGLLLSYTSSLLFVSLVLGIVAIRFVNHAQSRVVETSTDVSLGWRKIIEFSFFAWLSLLLRHATRPVNIFVIGALGTALMVGMYSVLERLVAVGVVFLMSINSMLAPMVSRLVERQDYVQLGRIYVLAARWSLASCVPVFVVLTVFGDSILMLFGAEFSGGFSALWLLAAAWIFSLLTGPADVILMMSGRSHYSAVNQVIMIILMVGLGYWLVPTWGLIGAVTGFAVATVVVNVLRVAQVQIHLQINPFGMPTTKVIVAGALMFCVLYGFPKLFSAGLTRFGWLSIVVTVLTGLVAYLVALIALKLESEELHAATVLRNRLPLKPA